MSGVARVERPATLYDRLFDRLVRQNPVKIFWIYRAFIWRSALADLRNRFVGSAVGVFWNILIPLAQIVIFTAVFSQLMPARIPGVAATNAFAIYLCSGLLPWIGFSECVSRGTHGFIENANYLKKLPIPEQVFVAQNAVGSTLTLGISMALLLVAALALGVRITSAWAAVVPLVLLLELLGFGLGLTLGSLNVFFRDIGQALGIALQMWMWVTPIVYVKEILPAEYQALLAYNPAYPVIDALHRVVIEGAWPDPWHWGLAAAWAIAATLLGYLVLRRLRPEIRDAL